MNKSVYHRWLVLVFFIGGVSCVQNVFAQLPTIKTSVDKNNILIGEQFHFKVETSMPDNTYRLSWFTMPDSVGNFHVVRQNKIDSSFVNGNINFSQVITITSFDSGSHMLPSMVLNLATLQGDSSFNLSTDSIPIQVSFAPMDSVKTFHDIKAIIEVKKEWEWWWWAVLAIGLLLIALLIWFLIKRAKKKKANPEVFKVKASPYDEAMQSLNELQQQKLLESNDVKEYHIRLTNIFKRYLSRKNNADKMYLTTDEVLMELKEFSLSQDQIFAFANCLRMSDAIKFAKYLPPQIESEKCLEQVKEMIISINKTLNINTESAV